MKINGLNVNKEFDSEPSLETWFKAFLDNSPVGARALTVEEMQMLTAMAQTIIDAYKHAEEYEGPITKLKKDDNGNIILPEGTLLHATPPLDEEKKIDYGKLSSIGKTGLISLGMLTEDAYGWDQEVPLQASFHRCKHTMTCEEKLQEICRLNKIEECGNILFIVDVHNDGLKKLLSFNITLVEDFAEDENIDRGNSYKIRGDTRLAIRLKKYPTEIESEMAKMALGYLLDACRPPSHSLYYSYLPIAVPSKYIVGIILPKKVEHNETLMDFLSKHFKNAILISSRGKEMKPLDRGLSL